MSLKPVELQIALPRTTEAGKLQQELQHRSALNQQLLAGENIKDSREQTQRSAEIDESSKSAVREDGRRGGSSSNGHSQEQKKSKEHNAEHPYKGRRFDVTL
ncbi:hypothetical protein [Paenibacillus rhizophilus]|uniref:RNA polymerase subunit sigma n=1 Tax=Paenibacillus rhizophilus TaxID=1850366 RepID=A0A3N9PAB1_9BACL|nr:hypothetical protein [Paenibacillus rhizophilus]RQW13153.1 hypothetical protein EH198_01630 [Paenibacillus rhizophilus]